MAVTNRIYGELFLNAFDEEIDYLADVIKITLHTSGYTPNQDTHNYQDDLTSELSTANGYTSGGGTLASKTNTYTGATNVTEWGGADFVWTASGTLTARTAVVACTGPGSAATNPLMTYHQSDADISATDASWTFDIPAAGIFTVTAA